ncbi:unnamed protein product [Vitrella brassicaformis CCMP3155]|uniref:Sushi domain-containing protein n=4 Tax=Vitrella brassicaformis TaxID=1169539 RepID=A0A0G4EI07_VITBC|nr:unnamed protein product [Vitrella brassicaformis CCMP3155]|eukprot:CEL96608.1 unnamed protein product [Vitrella brassicaformis CCMP3155]
MTCINGTWSNINLVCARECTKSHLIESLPDHLWAQVALPSPSPPPDNRDAEGLGEWQKTMPDHLPYHTAVRIACEKGTSTVHQCTLDNALSDSPGAQGRGGVPAGAVGVGQPADWEEVKCNNGTFSARTLHCQKSCDLNWLKDWEQRMNGYYVIAKVDPPAQQNVLPPGGCVSIICGRAKRAPGREGESGAPGRQTHATHGTKSPSTVTCENGNFSAIPVFCFQECGVVPVDVLSTLAVRTDTDKAPGETTPPETIVRLRCQPGYSSIGGPPGGQDEIKCLDGIWSKPLLDCKADCSAFPTMNPSGAYVVMGEGLTHGSTRTVECAPHHHPAVDGTPAAGASQCVDGSWTKVDILCFRDCPPFEQGVPLDPVRYHVFNMQNDFRLSERHGARYKVTCQEESMFFHERTRGASLMMTCVDGTWTRPAEEHTDVLPLSCKRACSDFGGSTNMTAEWGYELLKQEGTTDTSILFSGTQFQVKCLDTHSADLERIQPDPKLGITEWRGDLEGTAEPVDIVTCNDGLFTDRQLYCHAKCPEYAPPSPQEGYRVREWSPPGAEYKKQLLVNHGTSRAVSCNPLIRTSGEWKGHRMGWYAIQDGYGVLNDGDSGEKFAVVECRDGKWTDLYIKCEKVCSEPITTLLEEACILHHLETASLDALEPCYQDDKGNLLINDFKKRRACAEKRCTSVDKEVFYSPYRVARTIVQMDKAVLKNIPSRDQRHMIIMARKSGDVHLVVCDVTRMYAPEWRDKTAFLVRDPQVKEAVARVTCRDGRWDRMPLKCSAGCRGAFDIYHVDRMAKVFRRGGPEADTQCSTAGQTLQAVGALSYGEKHALIQKHEQKRQQTDVASVLPLVALLFMAGELAHAFSGNPPLRHLSDFLLPLWTANHQHEPAPAYVAFILTSPATNNTLLDMRDTGGGGEVMISLAEGGLLPGRQDAAHDGRVRGWGCPGQPGVGSACVVGAPSGASKGTSPGDTIPPAPSAAGRFVAVDGSQPPPSSAIGAPVVENADRGEAPSPWRSLKRWLLGGSLDSPAAAPSSSFVELGSGTDPDTNGLPSSSDVVQKVVKHADEERNKGDTKTAVEKGDKAGEGSAEDSVSNVTYEFDLKDEATEGGLVAHHTYVSNQNWTDILYNTSLEQRLDHLPNAPYGPAMSRAFEIFFYINQEKRGATGSPFGASCKLMEGIHPKAHEYLIWGPGCCDPANCWHGLKPPDKNRAGFCKGHVYGRGTWVAIQYGRYTWRHVDERGYPTDFVRGTPNEVSVSYVMCTARKWHVAIYPP